MDVFESWLFWATGIFGAVGLACLLISGMCGEAISQLVSGRDSLTPEQEKERSILFIKEDAWRDRSWICFLAAAVFLVCALVVNYNP